MQLDQTGYPMDRVATDIMKPLPETDNGNTYIVIISDYFTKWTEDYPLKNMEAQTVVEVLVEQFITRFGVPDLMRVREGCRKRSAPRLCFWYGPYTIKENLIDVTYPISKDGTLNTLYVHVDRLRHYGSQVLSNEMENTDEQQKSRNEKRP